MPLGLFAKNADDAASRDGAARKGSAEGAASKRSSVKKAAGLLGAPAQIMGPRLLLILSVVLLCAIGLVMVYSSSSILALNSEDMGFDPAYFLKRQGLFMGAGLVVCIACAAIPYRVWSKPWLFVAMWVITVGMLALTAFGMGVSALGAERSISLGFFALQPAEFGKISVLLCVAALVETQRQMQMSTVRFVALLAVTVLIPLFLIYRQPDLGTAIILVVGLMALAVLVGIPWIVIIGLVAVFALYVAFVCITQPYHLDRIVTMFDPFVDPGGKGFQSVQSLYALGSGGLFGTGLGYSRQKYLYLPYAHTDFIYAIIGEELGLVGTLAVALLFAAFIVGGLLIARNAPDPLGMSIAGAMTTMIGFQACVNMMCVIGIAPVTGKALPFISYGGSSIVASLIMVGIILSVSLRSSLDARYEQRRENLFVLSGGRQAQTAPAAAAAPGVAAGGLKVISGIRERATGAGKASSGTDRSSKRSKKDASSASRRHTAGSEQAQGPGRGTATARRSQRQGAASTRAGADSSRSFSSRRSDGHSSSGRAAASRGTSSRSASSRGASERQGSSRKAKGYASLGASDDAARSSSRASSGASTHSSQRSQSDDGVEYKGRIKYPSRSRPVSSSQRRRENRPGSRRR